MSKPIAKLRQWYSITNADDGESARIDIYDFIGESFWDSRGVSARKFAKELKAIKADTIDIHINSPGGLVFDGIAIHNAIKQHAATCVIHIDGLAASIASVIAMAGDEVRMAKNAFVMIHDPFDACWGTAEQMRKTADALDKVKTKIAESYADRSADTPLDKFEELMADETWLTAEECLDLGIIDAIEDETDASVSRSAAACLERYGNVPGAVVKKLANAAKAAAEDRPMPKNDDAAKKTRKALKNEEMPAEEETKEEEEETEEETSDSTETETKKSASAAKPKAASPKAATVAELKAALPKSTADFRETCIEAGLTVEQAKAMFSQAKPAETKAAAPGGPGLRDRKRGDDADDDPGDETDAWQAVVEKHTKRCGGNRARGMAAAVKAEPDLHREYLTTFNQRFGRKVG